MSRIGVKPITIPAGVEVTVDDNNLVKVKGPKGELENSVNADLEIKIEDGVLTVTRPTDDRTHRAQHGLARTLIHNMVVGVTDGFQKKMTINGVGYSASKKGNTLVLKLGFSHPVEMVDPEGIETEVPDATTVIVKGSDKAKVGNYAANIRAWRKPEPYKGKGIIMEGEVVQKKEGFEKWQKLAEMIEDSKDTKESEKTFSELPRSQDFAFIDRTAIFRLRLSMMLTETLWFPHLLSIRSSRLSWRTVETRMQRRL